MRVLEQFPFAAFVSKTITLAPRDGNPPPRLYETAAGLVNSIGLPNKGLRGYLEHDLPGARAAAGPAHHQRHGLDRGRAVRARRGARRARRGRRAGAQRLLPERVDRPGHRRRPRRAGRRPRRGPPADRASRWSSSSRPTPPTSPPSPRPPRRPGADAVSLINTLRAYAPTPAVASTAFPGWATRPADCRDRPSARSPSRRCARSSARVSIPVVGMGGVQSGLHAAHMLDAGATLVGVGTESFRDPAAGTRISRELDDLFAKSGDNLG